jgi:hypothetical protein
MQKREAYGFALRRLVQANRKRYNSLGGGVIARASRGQSLMSLNTNNSAIGISLRISVGKEQKTENRLGR